MTPILIEYQSLDLYVFIDADGCVDRITAYAGKDKATGEDKYTHLDCFHDYAEDEICELALKAMHDRLADEADAAAEDAAAAAYERAYFND